MTLILAMPFLVLWGFVGGLFVGVGIGARAWRRRFERLDRAAAAFLCSSTDDGKYAQANRARYGREVASCLSRASSLAVAAELEAQDKRARK